MKFLLVLILPIVLIILAKLCQFFWRQNDPRYARGRPLRRVVIAATKNWHNFAKFQILISTTGLILGIVASGLGLLSADEAAALSISPPRAVVTVDPGKSVIFTLEIKNTGSVAPAFSVGVVAAGQDDKGRAVFTALPETLQGWVVPAAESVVIRGQSETRLPFTIQVPAGAEPGSYYFGLTVRAGQAAAQTVGLITEAVALLEVQVAGVVREALAITGWQPAASRPLDRLEVASSKVEKRQAQGGLEHSRKAGGWFIRPTWRFQGQLSNRGSVTVPLLTGRVTVKTFTGQLVSDNPLPLGNALIAGARRRLNGTIRRPRPVVFPGRYRVTLEVVYGRSSSRVSASAVVWYWPLGSLTVLGGVIVVGGWWYGRRRRYRPQTKV